MSRCLFVFAKKKVWKDKCTVGFIKRLLNIKCRKFISSTAPFGVMPSDELLARRQVPVGRGVGALAIGAALVLTWWRFVHTRLEMIEAHIEGRGGTRIQTKSEQTKKGAERREASQLALINPE